MEFGAAAALTLCRHSELEDDALDGEDHCNKDNQQREAESDGRMVTSN